MQRVHLTHLFMNQLLSLSSPNLAPPKEIFQAQAIKGLRAWLKCSRRCAELQSVHKRLAACLESGDGAVE